MRKLYDIAEEVRKCTSCPLCRKRTLAVPGEGKGKIIVIGFNPTVEEDRLGTPFVGSRIDELLRIVDLSREDVFLTYCVKCHSKESELPKVCKKWLDEQISIIEPKLIVVLGEKAFGFLFDKDFNKVRGKVIEKKYFIASDLNSEIIIDDFEKLKKFI